MVSITPVPSSQATPVSTQPPLKKRKLHGAGESSQVEPSSFEQVLVRLDKDAADNKQDWKRPALPQIDPKHDSITFQQIDIEDSAHENKPVLRMFGVTEAGHSVLCHVSDFLPYFYVPVNRGLTNADIPEFTAKLNGLVPNGPAVKSLSIVYKRSLWGYSGDNTVPFLKITVHDQKYLPRIRNMFERGEIGFREVFKNEATMTFESNIQYILRFMIDKKVVGMNWIEVQAGGYGIRSEREKISTCQYEIDCSSDAILSHPAEGDWGKIAPLRILSFDLECAGRKGIFPEAEVDPVIQIANMVTRQGEAQPFIRNVFTLNTCSHIVGTQVLEFQDETKMLERWREFVQECDPDLIIGYNIANFDLPYLLDRAKKLKAKDFGYLGRLKRVKTEVKETHFSSKAYGTRDSKESKMDGRLQLDMLQVMQREYKLRSYSLNSVCAHFLGEQKEDVHHSIITELQNSGPEARRRLAVYCLKDAYLPQRLLDKLMTFVNQTEMARVTGVPFNFLLTRGQQIKVVSQLFRKADEEGYLVPALKSEGADEQYEGATVIEPNKGYYDVPIATLDFASLYPSIMMAHNLCYTTLVSAEQVKALGLVRDKDYILTPNNDMFVNPTKRKGLLPTVLEDLLAARRRARADLKVEKDPFKRAVLDGRQLALKISANSVYGFTGATVGKLPCLPISTSVTAFGRQMIDLTKNVVEYVFRPDLTEKELEECPLDSQIRKNLEEDPEVQQIRDRYNTEFDFRAEVIYGDTDSVMCKFGTSDLATAMELGAKGADIVSKQFVKPIKLEFEKVYFPYLLINKKRYAGLYWTKTDHYDKMDAKGIETVRRDNCRLVVTVIETCLKKLLIDRDVEGAQEYTKQVIADLLQNKVDMSQLVITKALAKTDYAAKQAHVELAERMKTRDAGSAPALGDRVAYVIIKGTKDARAYEKSEDPLYVLEHNIPIDTRYYLDNQLSKPLIRIFEPILGDRTNSLLAGDHTRTVSIATPTTGGLMSFVKKTLTCLGCKTPLGPVKKGMNTAVCKNCRPKLAELYQKHLSVTAGYENAYARLWVCCQRCQGSLHNDVLCTSKDCPIFYQRIKAKKDATEAQGTLERFDGSW